jgi:hypothetical protein
MTSRLQTTDHRRPRRTIRPGSVDQSDPHDASPLALDSGGRPDSVTTVAAVVPAAEGREVGVNTTVLELGG